MGCNDRVLIRLSRYPARWTGYFRSADRAAALTQRLVAGGCGAARRHGSSGTDGGRRAGRPAGRAGVQPKAVFDLWRQRYLLYFNGYTSPAPAQPAPARRLLRLAN